MPDIYGHRGKIGIVLPSTNTVVEPESDALRPFGVTNHVARISIVERPLNTEEAFMAHMQSMRAGIKGAIEQIVTCRPTHIIMAVVLEAFWGGVAGAEKLHHDLAAVAGTGVTIGSHAVKAALDSYGARRIAILTPHQPRGDEMVRLYFEQAGFDVVHLISLKRGSPLQIPTTTEAEMRTALHELARHDADIIVQVGTSLPMMDIAAAAEHWLGKPVLSINAVTYWHALRQAGVTDKVYGHGRILEDF